MNSSHASARVLLQLWHIILFQLSLLMLKLKTKLIFIWVMSLDWLWCKAALKIPPKNTTKKKDAPAACPHVVDAMLSGGASPPSTVLEADLANVCSLVHVFNLCVYGKTTIRILFKRQKSCVHV